jgi:hypothetical protein
MGILDYIKSKKAESTDYTKQQPSIRLVYADIVKVKNYHNC